MTTKNTSEKECCKKIMGMKTPCIEWVGTKNKKGYGVLTLDGKQWKAHRLAVILSGRRFQKGMVSDHICRNRGCINPNHIEIVTNVENVMRGESFAVLNAKKTKCIKGHSYKKYGKTTNRKGGKKWRYCGKCEKIAYIKKYGK